MAAPRHVSPGGHEPSHLNPDGPHGFSVVVMDVELVEVVEVELVDVELVDVVDVDEVELELVELVDVDVDEVVSTPPQSALVVHEPSEPPRTHILYVLLFGFISQPMWPIQ